MESSRVQNKKVLVVDDFANVRRSIRTMLMDLGFKTVVEAFDGASSTKEMMETKFDLILCDYNLGKGRNGSRLLEEWRSKKLISQEAIFVLITGETSRDVVISALELQPDDYLTKPFTMDVISKRIPRWFERREVLIPLLTALDQKNWEEVAKCARVIIEESPRHRSTAQKQYVEALIQQGLLTEAENFLHGLLEKRPLTWAKTEVHRIDLVRNDLDKAKIGFKNVIAADSNSMQAYDYLAETLSIREENEELQETLDQAINKSPHNIERQKKLVNVAQKNLDFKRSTQGLKDIMNLSVGTMHDSLGNYQEFTKGLQLEYRHSENDARKREIQKELVHVSKKIGDAFPNDVNATIFNNSLLVRKNGKSDPEGSMKKTNSLFAKVYDNLEEIIPETALFVTETFFLIERFDDGDDMVKVFKEKYHDMPRILKQFDDLQAEPVSLESRKQAKDLNVKGIEHYRKDEVERSIQCFNSAIELSPRHPGMILNFIQSHLKQMRSKGKNDKEIRQCLEFIRRLDYLPKDHYQFKRYDKIRVKLNEIKAAG